MLRGLSRATTQPRSTSPCRCWGGEQSASGLDIARARELELNADALFVASPAQLAHLLAQSICGICAACGLCNPRDLTLGLRGAHIGLLKGDLVADSDPLDRAAVGYRRVRLDLSHLVLVAALRRLLSRNFVNPFRLVPQAIHQPSLQVRQAKE